MPVTMSSTLPLAEVMAHLSELVGSVSSQHERITVTAHGRQSAVLVAVDDLEALEEPSRCSLHARLADRHSVRRGTYRVVYRINNSRRTVTVLTVLPQGDVYRKL